MDGDAGTDSTADGDADPDSAADGDAAVDAGVTAEFGSKSSPTTDSLADGWVAGLVVAAVGFGAVAGAVWLAPGSPFACDIPNSGGFLLCAWTRGFVANAVLLAGGLAVGVATLAIPLGLLRAVLRAVEH